MKTIYFIRDAKALPFSDNLQDFERGVSKRGYADITTIGSYLALQQISVDVILSSYALRAQETALCLAKKLHFEGEKYFLEELYYTPQERVLGIIMAQDDTHSSIMLVGHNPHLNELVNMLTQETIAKIPSLGVIAVKFDCNSWSEITMKSGMMDFFIYPKQFRYYVPKQIRTTLGE